MKRLITSALALAASQACLADGSPWLAEPGSTQLVVTQVQQSTDEFYKASNNESLGNELTQQTTWVGLSYGFDYDLSVDFKTGYSSNEQDGTDTQSGVTDSTVGVSWRLVDEFISYSNVPTTVLRAAVTFQGDYDTGDINAIGDGADGLEVSLIMGRFLTPSLAVSSEIGYRKRSSNVPDDAFYKVGGYVLADSQLSFSFNYSVVDAQDGLDIGGEGFGNDDGTVNFHKLEEDSSLVDLGISYNPIPKLNLSFNAGQVVDGKNTAKSDVYALTIGYTL
mgnify:CR=1 FL=1